MKPTFITLFFLAVAALFLAPSAEAADWAFGSRAKAKGRFSIVKEYSAAYKAPQPPSKKKTKRTSRVLAKANASRHRW